MKTNDTILHQQNFKVKKKKIIFLKLQIDTYLLQHTSIKCLQTKHVNLYRHSH